MAADGEKPRLGMFLRARPARRAIIAGVANKGVLDSISCAFEIADNAHRVSHQRTFISVEKRGEMGGIRGNHASEFYRADGRVGRFIRAASKWWRPLTGHPEPYLCGWRVKSGGFTSCNNLPFRGLVDEIPTALQLAFFTVR